MSGSLIDTTFLISTWTGLDQITCPPTAPDFFDVATAWLPPRPPLADGTPMVVCMCVGGVRSIGLRFSCGSAPGPGRAASVCVNLAQRDTVCVPQRETLRVCHTEELRGVYESYV